MEEIKLEKKYPNIRDEDVTEIFQEGYLKGFENGRKNAILIEWLRELQVRYLKAECYMSVCVVNEILNLWQKENQSLE